MDRETAHEKHSISEVTALVCMAYGSIFWLIGALSLVTGSLFVPASLLSLLIGAGLLAVYFRANCRRRYWESYRRNHGHIV